MFIARLMTRCLKKKKGCNRIQKNQAHVIYLKYKASIVKTTATLFSIFLLASCTNNYGDTNANDNAINKTDTQNDNIVITNIENSSLLENNSNPLIFNKINSLITYDDSQDKVDIKHDNTAISINLFGDDESDITLNP